MRSEAESGLIDGEFVARLICYGNSDGYFYRNVNAKKCIHYVLGVVTRLVRDGISLAEYAAWLERYPSRKTLTIRWSDFHSSSTIFSMPGPASLTTHTGLPASTSVIRLST